MGAVSVDHEGETIIFMESKAKRPLEEVSAVFFYLVCHKIRFLASLREIGCHSYVDHDGETIIFMESQAKGERLDKHRSSQ